MVSFHNIELKLIRLEMDYDDQSYLLKLHFVYLPKSEHEIPKHNNFQCNDTLL